MERNEALSSDLNYRSQILEIIRGNFDDNEKRTQLQRFHQNDLAAVFEELSSEEREHLLSVLGSELISEIVSYLDDAGEYLAEIDLDDAAEIIENMDADDAVEALDELNEQTRSEIIELIEDPEIKDDIRLIASYEDHEFGSRMSTNFICVNKNQTIKEAMKSLVREAAEKDNIFTIFAVNDDLSFHGAIDLKDLIVARSSVELESLIQTTFPFVYDHDIISENIERLRSYSENMIPIVSAEDQKLLGVITSTDITELIDEERDDDYTKLAAMTAEHKPDEPLLTSLKKRIPWLIALLFMGLVVSVVVSAFEQVVAVLPIIVSFQSLILGMAGNVGTQSLAVMVRTLSDKEENRLSHQLVAILKEVRVALLNGFALGLLSFALVSLYLFLGHSSFDASFILAAAGCVGLAMCFAMTISGFIGAAVPIGLSRLGLDPAIASGPLITTVNDLVAVVSYYGLAWLLLLKL